MVRLPVEPRAGGRVPPRPARGLRRPRPRAGRTCARTTSRCCTCRRPGWPALLGAGRDARRARTRSGRSWPSAGRSSPARATPSTSSRAGASPESSPRSTSRPGGRPWCRGPSSTRECCPTRSCSSGSRTSTSTARVREAGFSVLVDVVCARQVAHRQTIAGPRRGPARPPADRRRRAVAGLLLRPQLLRPGPPPRTAELVSPGTSCTPLRRLQLAGSLRRAPGHRRAGWSTAPGAGSASTPATCARWGSGRHRRRTDVGRRRHDDGCAEDRR